MTLSFPGSSDGKASACNAGDPGSIPGLGRSPGEGNGNPLSILPWRIPRMEEPSRLVHGVAKSQTRLRDFTFYTIYIIVERITYPSPPRRPPPYPCNLGMCYQNS